MNHTYRLVWNTASQSYQPASELARGHTRGRGRKLALALAIAAIAGGAHAGPDGGQVIDGAADIYHHHNTTDINQHSDNVTITWDTFDIDADEIVNFIQPGSDSLALNRIFSADGTQIQGQLNANGRVFLIDANGVLFGQTAQVNVGSLVASTLDVTATDGNSFTFSGNNNGATVANYGQITAADGGAVALLGGRVSNHGVIQAKLGNVALAAGNKVTLDFAGDGLLNVQVDEAALNALAENHGLIKADGGQVLMTAHASDALLQTVVNNTGVIEARGLTERDGKILLLGGMDEATGGTVRVAGTLDASSGTGNGGFVETSGTIVKIGADAVIDTSSEAGEAGTWLLDPTDLDISYDPLGGNNGTSHVHTQALQNSLAGGNVILQTAAAGAEAGDITIVDPIVWASGNRLTLNADNDIIFNDYLHAPNGGLTLNAANNITTGAEGHINVDSFILDSGNFSQIAATLPTFIARDFTLNGGTFTRATGGNGSTTPLQIADIYGLQGLGTTLDFDAELVNDIDASGTAGWNGGEGFDPIGTFTNEYTGSFDGAGFVIDGLTINRPSELGVGLFGHTSASANITDLGLTQVALIGESVVGGLVGFNEGSISNSYATGTVTGTGMGTGVAGVGGLVGGNLGDISSSYAAVTVTGDLGVGGLVGRSPSDSFNTSSISNSYATGDVTGNESVGGLVGVSDANIITSYASGAVDGTSDVGGLVGTNEGTTTASYWDGFTTGMGSTGAGANTGTFTATEVNGDWGNVGVDAYNEASYAALDFTNDWFIAEGSSRPMLRAFLDGGNISNLYQLQGMAANLAGDYTLLNDIDASATADSVTAGNGGNFSDVWGGRGFAPVGVSGDEFTGSLDGQGFVIDGLTINRPNQSYIGLFGYTSGSASVNRVGLTEAAITGYDLVGGLVGYNAGDIASSYASGAVDGNIYIGGLVGYNAGDIASSYASGAVDANFFIGGLVGTNDGDIATSYATGVVDGNIYIGGLVGINYGNVASSYATGAVNGDVYIGGLVGINYANIASSYASGAVDGNIYIGGLVGINDGTVNSSYWDGHTTGMGTAGVGGNTGAFTAIEVNGNWGSDTAYNQATYADFDFTNDWFIAEGSSRPMLRAFLSGGGEIHNLYDLQGMAADLGGTYTLMADIDASATTSTDNADVWGGRGFAPVGTQDFEFTGNLDGNGFVIDGLTIDRADQAWVGLFGYTDGAALNQIALTQVDIVGNDGVGALVGVQEGGTTTNSYSTGQVQGLDIVVGGLVGGNLLGSISASYSEASVVVGDQIVGGLVGWNEGDISNSYATGSVSGSSAVGGLVGINYLTGEISHSYAAGDVTGVLDTGGLVGLNLETITNSFWNTDIEAVGVGSGDTTGATGLTTVEFMDPASFAVWGTDINATGAGSAIWRIYAGNSSPLLRAFLTDIDVIAYDDYKVYDGAVYDGLHDINGSTGAGVRYGTNYAEFLSVFGEDGTPYSSDAVNSSDLTYEGDSQGAEDAGTYTITPGNLWSNQTGYNIQLVDGELTIDQLVVNVTVDINDASKQYGNADPTFTWSVTSGTLAPGDRLTGRLSRQSGENVGTYTIRGTITGDLASGNYDVTLNNGVFTITPRPITIDIADLDKIYGEADPTLNWTVSGGSLAFNDTLEGTLTRAPGEDVGDYAITGEFTGDLASPNYTVSVNDGVLTIVPRSLVISVEDLAKIYGEDDPEFVWAQAGTLAEGDTLSVEVTRAPGEDVGTYSITPTVSGDVLSPNYNLSIVNGELVISPAALTVTADDIAAYWNLLPPFTTSVDGLTNGDTLADVFGNSLSVTSNLTQPIPGDYTLTPSATIASNNYTVSFANGTLTLLSSHPGGNYVEALTATQLPAREALGRENRANIYEGRDLPDGSLEAITLAVLDGGIKLDPDTLKAFGIPMPKPVYFINNRYDLSEADKAELAAFAETLKQYPDISLKVEGHTSSTGSAALNERLGQRRAQVVADFLVEQGIARDRIITEGHSFRRPAATNDTLEGQALNRRTEVSEDE